MPSHGASIRFGIAASLLATAWVAIAADRTTPAAQQLTWASTPPVVGPWPVPLSVSSLSRTSVPLPGPPSVQRPALRVGIIVEGAQTTIGADSGVEVWLRAGSDAALRGVRLPRATFEPAPNAGVRLVETGDQADEALAAPSVPSELLVTDRHTYRGLMEVRPATRTALTVVNVVNIEDYIRGVVPNELSSGAPSQFEALKAQAVAARTYALAHLGAYSSKGFDLCATQSCQVYRGAASEHPLSDRAVAETRGVLATWRGRPIRAYYTSACGGHTESGRDVFDDNAPYLRGVECAVRGHAEWPIQSERAAHSDAWEVRLTPAQVLSTLARYGTVGPIRDLVPHRTGASGRVVELEVIGAEGKMLLRGVKVRWGLGLPESLFVIGRETTPDGAVERFVITGFGRGHGVGLCQLGAAAMARSGASFVAILKHYYTGITLTRGSLS